jgi:nuclear pore complex protein Nup98-Nup96
VSTVQLEAAGLWEWAVYVLLHVGPDGGREAVMELVARHLPLPQDETHAASFQFLTQRLGIPEHLLHETLVLPLAMTTMTMNKSSSL